MKPTPVPGCRPLRAPGILNRNVNPLVAIHNRWVHPASPFRLIVYQESVWIEGKVAGIAMQLLFPAANKANVLGLPSAVWRNAVEGVNNGVFSLSLHYPAHMPIQDHMRLQIRCPNLSNTSRNPSLSMVTNLFTTGVMVNSAFNFNPCQYLFCEAYCPADILVDEWCNSR